MVSKSLKTTEAAVAKTTKAATKTKADGKATKKSTAKGKGAKLAGKKKTGLASTVGKRLVIVESPAKARTVGQILGNKYVVTASQGHVHDLPKGKMGVDFENDFEPSYVTIRDKQTILTSLKKAGAEATEIYLATDPDREGEAISWHLQTAAAWDKVSNPPKRVVFHEITKQAVEEAFDHPREIDMQMVNAQQARRILDRLVGYQISPLLWRRVQRGLSAGRVQSVSLRMVTDREKEIEAFVPEESWTLESQLHKTTDPADKAASFTATLRMAKGDKKRLIIPNGDEARGYEAELKDAAYAVAEVRKRDVRQRPTAPFTTSTMQQEAGRKLRFTAQRTMMVAQQLYEGVSVGSEGSIGLITYMRTDSVQVAQVAIQEARDYIAKQYGKEFVPDKPRVYTTKSKSAQEAHEAIRPTSISRNPDSVKDFLTAEQLRLYTLIWSRMLASQMADARSEATTAEIEATCKESLKVYMFRATGSVLKFAGFRTLYLESQDDTDDDDGRKTLPVLTVNDVLNCLKLDVLQHFTQPPPRYTEATLVKTMEEKGIGRPSTYAPTIGTLLARSYLVREQNRLFPTPLGITVVELLTQFFTDVMDFNFTARMEDELDDVSRGDREWVPMLREFYGPFEKAMETATENMPRVKVEEETDEICDNCEKPMVIKTGRFGRFIACTGFPECKTTKPILKKTGAACPKCEGQGELVERRSKGKRRPFYGCTRYPECDFISNKKPVANPCPECDALVVEDGHDELSCTVCSWNGTADNREQDLVAVGD